MVSKPHCVWPRSCLVEISIVGNPGPKSRSENRFASWVMKSNFRMHIGQSSNGSWLMASGLLPGKGFIRHSTKRHSRKPHSFKHSRTRTFTRQTDSKRLRSISMASLSSLLFCLLSPKYLAVEKTPIRFFVSVMPVMKSKVRGG